MTKIYDLSQDLNQDCSFWPFYPPFEVKYIKRKSEQGVNAQYIQTSNHMGTHLDAPRHFVTKGKTIDQIPIEWCYGPGVIVDLSDMLDELGLFTPEDIEKRADLLLEELGLGHRTKNTPPQLSGGERQRVAIGRALMTADPNIMCSGKGPQTP